MPCEVCSEDLNAGANETHRSVGVTARASPSNLFSPACDLLERALRSALLRQRRQCICDRGKTVHTWPALAGVFIRQVSRDPRHLAHTACRCRQRDDDAGPHRTSSVPKGQIG
jgi:hypothetical protein